MQFQDQFSEFVPTNGCLLADSPSQSHERVKFRFSAEVSNAFHCFLLHIYPAISNQVDSFIHISMREIIVPCIVLKVCKEFQPELKPEKSDHQYLLFLGADNTWRARYLFKTKENWSEQNHQTSVIYMAPNL